MRKSLWNILPFVIILVLVAFIFIVTILALSGPSRNEIRERNRQECIDRGGIVRESSTGRYEGCYYNLPEVER